MARFVIEKERNKYRVLFFEGKGVSTLDETKSLSAAKKSLNKFRKDLSEGIPLRPTKRVAGWQDYYPRKKLKKVV